MPTMETLAPDGVVEITEQVGFFSLKFEIQFTC